MKTIGFLVATSRLVWKSLTDAFEAQGAVHGWKIGTDINIDYREADGQLARYDAIAREFVREPVDIIVTGGNRARPRLPQPNY
jgi:ABC-type uncharacterized transport system substrate-binding protein